MNSCSCTLWVQLRNLSLSGDSWRWFLDKVVCSFLSCRARSPFIPKGCYMRKRSRVRGYCSGRQALVYRVILQGRGTIYEVAGSNSGVRAEPSRGDAIGLQKVRRGGQGSFEAAGYTVYFSGSEKGANHMVGLAVAKRIVEASRTCTPDPIIERLLRVQLSLTRRWNRVTFVVAYAPVECAQ